MLKPSVGVAATHELFPCVIKDIESGVYVAECQVPVIESLGHVQLVIDNNVMGALKESPLLFARLGWLLGGASRNTVGSTHTINPFFVIAEQFLSNPANALAKVEAFTQHSGVFGTFTPDHGKTLLAEIRRNEQALRSQVGTLVCYLFVMREIYWQTHTYEERIRRWVSYFQEDVSRLMLVYVMGMLFFFGREDEKMRFKTTDRPVRAWADAFLTPRKKEVDDPASWVRNRVFDLLPFLMAPTLNWETHGGIPGRLFVLSKDKDVGECLLRIFAWHGDQKANSLWKLQTNLECLHFEAHTQFQSTALRPPEARPTTPCDRALRMRRLIDVSLGLLPAREQGELLGALNAFRWLDSPDVTG